ncbi:MAG TPA: MFS transporter [Longimicrobium sp.]|nr:MFS transporter [Longimicrobium sp.]
MNQAERPAGRVHYAWVVAGVTFVVLLVSAGIRATPGVLMVPLESEFGWTRATISLAISVNLVLYGLIGPFAAALMERLGVRRTMMLAMAALALAVGATTLMTRPWQLVLLWGVVVGGATGMGALVLGAVVVNRWFHERRGVVMGILTASAATGQLVFLPVLAWLSEHRGWRAPVMLVAGAAAVTLPLVLLLMRERPGDVGLRPYGAQADGDAAAPAPTAAAPLAALARGVRSRDWWLLFATFLICGASTNGLIGTHFIPAAHDHGIPQVAAAGLLAVMGVCDLLGTTLSGWLSDRWDSRKLLAWYYGLRGLSLIFLPLAFTGPHLSLGVFALFYGLDWVATVPPTVRLTADAFGKENVGVMFGWIVAGHQLGAAFAAGSAGAVRTWMGDYQAAFIASGVLCIAASILALNVGRTRAVESVTGATPEPLAA